MEDFFLFISCQLKNNKLLERYGWGIARYTTPEALYLGDKTLTCKGRSPEESKKKIVDYLSRLLPDATELQILKVIG